MDDTHSDFAVIIVFFNPSSEHVSFAASLSNIFGTVLIVDNSPAPINDLNLRFKDCLYWWMGRNLGIAAALNYGCIMAMSLGAKYALLLDQDTVFKHWILCRHIETAQSLFVNDRIALVATGSQLPEFPKKQLPIQVNSAITSGSIIRLSAWRETGRFNDGLFIDQVDHDFCIRLRLSNYVVLANPTITMKHSVGEPLEKNIFGRRIATTNHNWLRRYYQVRNSLYLRRWYPSESKSRADFLWDMFMMAAGIILLERDRIRKLYAMVMGAVDFWHNRLGPWREFRNYRV